MSALSTTAFAAAARILDCEIAAVRAVDEVESRGAGFDERGRVKILFEPHVFHRYTGGVFGESHPDLSYPKWIPGAPSYQLDQHELLERARALVPESGPDLRILKVNVPRADLDVSAAAAKSCSWGRYQIMGFNWRFAGLRSIQAFEAAMIKNEGEHLASFVSFIRSDNRLLKAIRAKQWEQFAKIYNGEGYAQNNYHNKLAAAYKKHKDRI